MNPINHLQRYGYLKKDIVFGMDEPVFEREEVLNSIRLYKSFFFEEINELAQDKDEIVELDGMLTAATLEHMMMPRCSVPDFTEEELSSLGGRGSWPMGCHGSGQFHQVNVLINFTRMPSFLKDVFEEIWDRVQSSYADKGVWLKRVTKNQDVNIDLLWEPLRGPIGLAQVGRNQTCRTRLWAKLEPGYRPAELIDQTARLIAHEIGHNKGLSHSRGGIMNPTITRGTFTRTSWRNDPSEPILNRWFGGVPFPQLTTTTEEPPTTTTAPPSPPEKEQLEHGLLKTNDGIYYLSERVEGEPEVTIMMNNKIILGSYNKMW